MNYKKWLYTGLGIFVGSGLLGFLVPLWGISSSFKALETNESASIGAVQGGIEIALYSTIFFMITGGVGVILFVIGCVKAYRNARSQP